MTDLIITVPHVNEQWIENNISELMNDGCELLHATEPTSIAFSVGSTEFGEVFDDLEDDSYDSFYANVDDHFNTAVIQSKDCARLLFQDYDLWNRTLVTMADIHAYNEVLKELVFQISENVAHQWISFLALDYDEDEYQGSSEDTE